MINQLRDWLSDESTVLKILNPRANQTQQISIAIKESHELLNRDGKEHYGFIHELVKKVNILKEAIQITINPNALFEDLPHPVELITVETRAKIERCGMAMRLLIGNRSAIQNLDQTLINSIRKAQNWLEQLTTGKVNSVGDIATQEGTTSNAITRLIYRAFLAPDIIRAIMNGTQPTTLNSDLLKTIAPFPLDWDEQRKMLGFN